MIAETEMAIREILLSTPAAGCLFLALVYGLYRLGGALAAKGEDHPGKRQPYACGEDLLPPEAQLSYHAFFQLALMFGLLHVATLVISTLPPGGASQHIALVYLFGISVSVLVLERAQKA
jgi:NADH:ubiquinone oxidoreductase subunit 3 (subunit A)